MGCGKNVHFGGNDLCVSGSHVALSQHLPSYLFPRPSHAGTVVDVEITASVSPACDRDAPTIHVSSFVQ